MLLYLTYFVYTIRLYYFALPIQLFADRYNSFIISFYFVHFMTLKVKNQHILLCSKRCRHYIYKFSYVV
jgi:hypothetical protein